jgi:hypothetical protein
MSKKEEVEKKINKITLNKNNLIVLLWIMLSLFTESQLDKFSKILDKAEFTK